MREGEEIGTIHQSSTDPQTSKHQCLNVRSEEEEKERVRGETNVVTNIHKIQARQVQLVGRRGKRDYHSSMNGRAG